MAVNSPQFFSLLFIFSPPSESLKLQRNINKYEILKDTNADDDDKTQFYYTKKSLEMLGFTGEEILSVFKIIAVVLKLGNLNFIPITNIDGTEGCEITNDYGECGGAANGVRVKKIECEQEKKPFQKFNYTFHRRPNEFSRRKFSHFPLLPLPSILSPDLWESSTTCAASNTVTPQKSEILHSS